MNNENAFELVLCVVCIFFGVAIGFQAGIGKANDNLVKNGILVLNTNSFDGKITKVFNTNIVDVSKIKQ